jgi:hypothetical protein
MQHDTIQAMVQHNVHMTSRNEPRHSRKVSAYFPEVPVQQVQTPGQDSSGNLVPEPARQVGTEVSSLKRDICDIAPYGGSDIFTDRVLLMSSKRDSHQPHLCPKHMPQSSPLRISSAAKERPIVDYYQEPQEPIYKPRK